MNKIKYVGDGGFILGVPTRNLTQEDFDAFDKDTQALILASGLYEITIDKPAKASKKESES